MTGLSTTPTKNPLLTRKDAARYLGISVSTLARWAMEGTGPAYSKAGRVRYRLSDLDAFIEEHRVQPVRRMAIR